MARILKNTSTGPIKIEPGTLPTDKAVFICACGLSQKMPYCDGSHKITRDESAGMLYVYSADGKVVVETPPDESPDPAPGISAQVTPPPLPQ
ncbi:hypothetical protein BH11PLA1_BH11PLA1_09230 [soil metagenome]